MRNHVNIIEYPDAYAAAIRSEIYIRASAKRQREWDAANPDLAEWLRLSEQDYWTVKADLRGPVPTFARKQREDWGSLSEKSTSLLRKIMTERQEKAAGRVTEREEAIAAGKGWKAGRQQVEGTIISSKWAEGFRGGEVNKWLVKTDDGLKVFFSAPTPFWVSSNEPRSRNEQNSMVALGDRVTVTLTIEPSQDDVLFAFGKRPAKATVTPSHLNTEEVK